MDHGRPLGVLAALLLQLCQVWISLLSGYTAHEQQFRSLLTSLALLQGNRIGDKEAVLVTLCSRSFRGGKTIVFFRTKQRAHRAKILFGLAGLPPAAELHGNMSQSARLESLDKFRKVWLNVQCALTIF